MYVVMCFYFEITLSMCVWRWLCNS